MDVEIISTSCIAPSSSPLPPHLQTYKLSLLDQFLPSSYWGSILFYPNPQLETNIRSQSLKQSFSETLSRFYPYAGKIKDNLFVDCSDDGGVCYTDAQCKISLSQLLTQPDLVSLQKLMPNATSDELPSGSPVALIQETTFACGGFSIGMCVSHIVCDVYSHALFLKEWAATARKVATRHPFLGVESIFPQWTSFPREKILTAYVCARFAPTGKSATKRIVFKESAIAKLKAKASSTNNPTRSEVVMAFLVKCLMICFKIRAGGDNKPLATTIAVNLRRKKTLLEYSLGNVLSVAGTVFTSSDEEEEGKELNVIVNQLREALGKVDNEFMNKIKIDGDEIFKYHDTLKQSMDLHKAPEYAALSSLCNFGFYDIDFGWGKPMWAVILPWVQYNPDTPNFNGAVLMDTRTGRGVEAWVSLLQQDFHILEKHTHLLQYASIDPSPLYNSSEPTSKL